jgi:uncharacterized membrane protein
MITPIRMAQLFALFGTLSVLLLATLMPPWQNPDEGAHFARADQISHLGLIARCGPAAPPQFDAGVLINPFDNVPFHQAARVKRELYAPIAWGGRVANCMPNTSIYPPTFYVPAAIAIALGRVSGLTVLPTQELARAAGGLAAVLVGSVAIALAGPAAIWLFAVLTLPMSLTQMAAVSQDGLMIATGALATALTLSLQSTSTRYRWAGFAALFIAVLLVATARPPYFALAALLLLIPDIPRALRALAAALVLAVLGWWCWLTVARTGVDMGHFGPGNVDAKAQLVGLLYPPWRIVSVAYTTLTNYYGFYLETFLGRPGWLDIYMPFPFLWAVAAMLCMAGLVAWRGSSGVRSRHFALYAGLGVLAVCTAIFGIQFLTWTPVGDATVEGVQGRYFLVPVLAAGLLFVRPRPSGSRLAAVFSWPVLLFPIVTLVVTLHRILLRYYL